MSDEVKERPRVRLEWLAIERFREVAPGTRLEFAPGVNLLLGMNGSGKTTLLDLIAACVRGDFSAYADETFALRYGLRAGAMGYEFQVSNEEVVVDPGLREVMREMSHAGVERSAMTCVVARDGERERSRVEISPERAIRRDDGHPDALELPRGLRASPLAISLFEALLIFSMQKTSGGWDYERALVLVDNVDPQHGVVRFDEALGFFLTKTAQRTDDSYMFSVFATPSGKFVSPHCAVPQQFVVAAYRQASRSLDGAFRLDHAHLTMLGRVAELAGFKKIEMVFPAPEVRTVGDREANIYRPPDFLCTREDGQVVRHNHLSFGQKRLLAFFYYVACNPDVVVADELVNGLHHGWIARCLQEIGDRQAFLTSQNPLLVDMVPFQGADELRRSFVVCGADHDPNDPKRRLILRWRPLDAREAEELAALLSVDVQPASEILLAMGLW